MTSLSFAGARDSITGQTVRAAVVPGEPLSDEERKQQGRTPKISEPGIRAWPGDIVVCAPAAPIAAQDPAAILALEAEAVQCSEAVSSRRLAFEQARHAALDARKHFRAARVALGDAEVLSARAAEAVRAALAEKNRVAREHRQELYVVLSAESKRIVFDADLVDGA